MNIVFKKILTSFFWCLSKLPFGLLYMVSSFFAFFVQYVIKYRREIVKKNLDNAFPEKSSQEKRKITKQFYKNFIDFILEVIKIKSLSIEKLSKRITFNNYEILDNLYQKKKSIIVVMGHCGNFEWTSHYLHTISPYKVNGIVKPLKDPYFENYLRKIRLKFNPVGQLILLKNVFRTMIKMKDELTITLIAGDQTPKKNEITYWTNFLNQKTPVFTGIERLAKKFDLAVVFFDIQRNGRGHYIVDISLIQEDAKNCEENEITEMHVKLLENAISKHPDNWLWSHRRWKHSKI